MFGREVSVGQGDECGTGGEWDGGGGGGGGECWDRG